MAYKTFQDQNELDEFIALVRKENVSSYLEIGSKYGGSLWQISNALPKGSRIVSVDLPGADKLLTASLPSLQRCVSELNKIGYRAQMIVGDSTSNDVINQVRVSSPFDLCLIDGGHSEPVVRADWRNYGPMARIVAFHDISWPVNRPTQPANEVCHVGTVWREIKGNYRSMEIVHNADCLGFGIVWRDHANEMRDESSARYDRVQ